MTSSYAFHRCSDWTSPCDGGALCLTSGTLPRRQRRNFLRGKEQPPAFLAVEHKRPETRKLSCENTVKCLKSENPTTLKD
ncbi:hypothetical protein R3I94_016329 [Phoxinus phoxinus]|uniref:Uncharacterized protein n=1 Tax=Phoxinus phoxinus TaxID=58324 RepID=A0AAN9H059_9TELE